MLQTYRVQFEYKLYHFVGEAGVPHSTDQFISCCRVFALLQTSSHRYSSAQAIPTYRQSFPYSYYSVASLFQNFCPGVCVPCAHYYNYYYYR